MAPQKRLGRIFVISSASGVGKTTLVKELLQRDANLRMAISYTSRPKRANEKDGVNYHFIAEDKFQKLIAAGEFLEYATVYGYSYGTSKSWVEQEIQAGHDVVLELDWQGNQSVRAKYSKVTSIFILPPSLDAVEQRLTARAQDSAAVIAQRLEEVKADLAHYQEFDFIVINDKLEQAGADLAAIIRAQTLSQEEQSYAQRELIKSLLD